MYICSLHNAILCLCMYIHNTCAIQSYARACISVMLAQCLHNNKAKMRPVGDNCGLSGGRFAQQATIASFGGLAAYIALTAALVCYAKDKRAFITTRQRVEQTIKDLRHRVCTWTLHQLGDALANDCHYSACTWANITRLFKLYCIYQVLCLLAS